MSILTIIKIFMTNPESGYSRATARTTTVAVAVWHGHNGDAVFAEVGKGMGGEVKE